jgi:hypothetical protein
MRPEPVGFRWYLRSPLPVSWLATEVVPAIRYLRRTERMAVVNVRRGWRHGNHLEVIAYSGDDRAVPWPHLLARLRPPAEQVTLPPQPHGTFDWIGHDDLQPWPGSAQTLRERALTTMGDSLADTIEAAGPGSPGDAPPAEMAAEIMLAASDAHPLRFPPGTSSYHAGGPAILGWPGTARAPQPGFESRLADDRLALRALVARMLTGQQTPSSASWRRTALYCAGLFDGAVLGGSLTARTLDEISDVPGAVSPDAPCSPDQALLSYRLVLSLLRVQLSLLDVSPADWCYLCWAVTEVAGEVAGDS